MHALTCAESPTTTEREREKKKTQNTEHNEVRVKLKNFSGGFSANT